MPPKVASKVLPPKQKGAPESKPLGIKPPTKAQIQAAKGNVKPGGTVIKAAEIQNLLKKDIAPEFQNEQALDLTKMPAPRDFQVPTAAPVTSYGLPDEQNIPQVPSEPAGIQWGQNVQSYQPPSYQAPGRPQSGPQIHQMPAQDVRKKKPSEMTKEEYAEYEKQRERSNWARLINIVVWRTPSTFERNEAEDLCRKEPEFAALFNSEMARKELQAPTKAEVDPRKAEPILPERRAGDKGSFKPTYDVSEANKAAQFEYQRPAAAPAAGGLQVPQILPDITQQFEQSNQIFESQKNMILQLQQQIQQLQHQQLSNQLNNNNMQIVPITNSANQHLLQSVQDLQVELQLTQAQASKYQQEVYQLTQEKRQLESLLQTEQGYRAAAEQRAASMQLDLESLKAQISDLRDKLERATTAEMEARAAQGARGGFQLPGGAAYKPANLFNAGGAQAPAYGAPASGFGAAGFVQPEVHGRRPASQPGFGSAPAVESHESKREDPNFGTAVSNDIDQIMRNANLILDKYQNFDDTYNTPAGQQVRQVYQNLMHGQVELAPAPSQQGNVLFPGNSNGNGQQSAGNSYQTVEQLYQGGGPPGKAVKEEKDVDKTIEDLLQDNETHLMSTQDIQAAPTEIPMSLLDGIPDEDNPSLINNNGGPEEIQYQQEAGEYNAEHVGSLLPHSKFNARK